jgi:hypothetical protein
MDTLAARINEALPQTQCTRCGYADCAAYATAIADGEVDLFMASSSQELKPPQNPGQFMFAGCAREPSGLHEAKRSGRNSIVISS